MSAARRLARALQTSARLAGYAARVTEASDQPWSSATFSGARHALVLEGDGLAGWAATLAEATLVVPGHVVAELRVEAGEPVRLTALTLVAG